jgi:PLD-like domain
MLETQAYFTGIKDVILEQLDAAEKNIFVAVAWFTDKDLYEKLCQKARKGLAVQVVIVDDDINNGSYGIDKQAIAKAGGKIYQVSDALMHHKFCVIDEYVVISGSYNWTYKAANENIENITVTQGDKNFAEQFKGEFHKILERHFGEKGQVYSDAPPDIAKISKRLEVIAKLIELEDTEDLTDQCHRLQRGTLTAEVEAIIQQLQKQRFSEAMSNIQAFLNKHRQLMTYTDPRLAALRLEIKLLQVEVTALANEESEVMKLVRAFSIHYNNEVGELMQEILFWRRKKAIAAAQENPDKQAEDEEAKQDYEQYREHHEALKAEPLAELSEEEKKALKVNFRKAAMLCHPDKVNESMEAQATALYQDLQVAYERNDVARVNEILQNLEKGNFATRSEEVQELQLLEYEVIRLRKRKTEILENMETVKATDTWQTLSVQDDWDAYFTEIKTVLKQELQQLLNALQQ